MPDNELKQLIYVAYRKLKNYFYYDNSSLIIRNQIADFEKDLHGVSEDEFKVRFEEKTKSLYNALKTNDELHFSNLYKSISCFLLPKNMNYPDSTSESKSESESESEFESESESKSDSSFAFTNDTSKDELAIGEYNIFINAPIEIHLISVLWTMLVGPDLSKLVRKNNYAYRFVSDEQEDDRNQEEDNKLPFKHSLQLYRPYYQGYQQWRDNAICKAEGLLEDKEDAIIVSLDIRKYYYNVRINLIELVNKYLQTDGKAVGERQKWCQTLTKMLAEVHCSYQNAIKPYLPNDISANEKAPMLPLGLVSSGLLANLYLKDFDDKVIDDLNPVYYGRYVDDMLFVIKATGNFTSKGEIIQKYFEKCNLLSSVQTDKETYYKVTNGITDNTENKSNLVIQEKKVVIGYFKHNDSKALLLNFKRNLKRHRSEFRFLPDEDYADKDFDQSAYSIEYSGSVNKMRSIKAFKEDKFGASAYLANLIFLARYDDGGKHSNANKIKEQIFTFFKGDRSIGYYSLWEKVFTYFVVTGDWSSVDRFRKIIRKNIGKCKLEGENVDSPYGLKQLKSDLEARLNLSIAMPLSMNLTLAEGKKNWEDILEKAKTIRRAALFRHKLLAIDGIYIIENVLQCDDINLLDFDVCKAISIDDDIVRSASVLLSPHFIHIEETTILALLQALNTENNGNINNKLEKAQIFSKQAFKNINRQWQILFFDEDSWNQSEQTDNINYVCDGRIFHCNIKDEYKQDATKVDKRIAIANIKVDTDIIPKIALQKIREPLGFRNQLFSLINEAVSHKCDMLVLPELAVPYEWLGLLVAQSKKNDIAIVTGLRYFINGTTAYNMVVAILPYQTKYGRTCAILPRVKNHYAPAEITQLKSYHFDIPDCSNVSYHIYHWKRTYFSVYNCFELASIEDRALIKSKVDFVIATELNKDTRYYSDIAGSWVRDIHAYIIQVNSSEFGDSRIMQPSPSDTRDMVIVKGGKNSTILVEDLAIKELREFQYPEYEEQNEKGNRFKVTPPDFDKKMVLRRIEDEELYWIKSLID